MGIFWSDQISNYFANDWKKM